MLRWHLRNMKVIQQSYKILSQKQKYPQNKYELQEAELPPPLPCSLAPCQLQTGSILFVAK